MFSLVTYRAASMSDLWVLRWATRSPRVISIVALSLDLAMRARIS